MKIIEVTFRKLAKDPLWFVLDLCLVALALSWTAKSIYCGWAGCEPQKPAISVEANVGTR